MRDKNQTERVVRHIEAMGISRMAPSEISPGKIARMARSVPALEVVADLAKDRAGTHPFKDIKLFTRHGLALLCIVVVVLATMVNAMFGRFGTDNEAKMIFACTVIVALVELVVIIVVRMRPAWRMFTHALDVLSGGLFVDLVGYYDLTKVQNRAIDLLTKAAVKVVKAEANHEMICTLVSAAELTDRQDEFLKMYDALSILPGLGEETGYLNPAREDLKKMK